jgi:hypothetical protein
VTDGGYWRRAELLISLDRLNRRLEARDAAAAIILDIDDAQDLDLHALASVVEQTRRLLRALGEQ